MVDPASNLDLFQNFFLDPIIMILWLSLGLLGLVVTLSFLKEKIYTEKLMIKVSTSNFTLLYLQRYFESLQRKVVFWKQTNDFKFEKEDSFNMKVFGKFWNRIFTKYPSNENGGSSNHTEQNTSLSFWNTHISVVLPFC